MICEIPESLMNNHWTAYLCYCGPTKTLQLQTNRRFGFTSLRNQAVAHFFTLILGGKCGWCIGQQGEILDFFCKKIIIFEGFYRWGGDKGRRASEMGDLGGVQGWYFCVLKSVFLFCLFLTFKISRVLALEILDSSLWNANDQPETPCKAVKMQNCHWWTYWIIVNLSEHNQRLSPFVQPWVWDEN